MKRNSFISLFSGGGGLDLGLETSGWHCRYASDVDSAAVETLKINKGRRFGSIQALEHAHLEQADVRHLSGRNILAKAGMNRGEITLLAGGPPCQSWSSAGHQKGFGDPRGQLFMDFIRIANEMEVRWLLFENVRGLLTARGPDGLPGSALKFIRSQLLENGYQTSVTLLNAADYGIPQRRVRLFVVGYRIGDAPRFANPTHGKVSDLLETGLKPWVTLGQCLRGLLPIRNDEIIRPSKNLEIDLARLTPGSGVKSQGKVESTRPGGHWGYKQGAFIADLDIPARTVTASAQQDWIIDPRHGIRRLTPRECAALQTFPENWHFAGNSTSQYRLIGNAVPPQLASIVGNGLINHKDLTDLTKESLRSDLLPLSPHLAAAIRYTAKEEFRNGASRKSAPSKRARWHAHAA